VESFAHNSRSFHISRAWLWQKKATESLEFPAFLCTFAPTLWRCFIVFLYRLNRIVVALCTSRYRKIASLLYYIQRWRPWPCWQVFICCCAAPTPLPHTSRRHRDCAGGRAYSLLPSAWIICGICRYSSCPQVMISWWRIL